MSQQSRNRPTTRITRRTTLRSAGLLATTLGLGTSLAGTASANPGRGRGREQVSQVTFNQQTTDGRSVTVPRMFLPEGGYMSIHDAETRFDESVGGTNVQIVESLIGITELFEPGVHTNVRVPLFNEEAPAVVDYGRGDEAPLGESQPLIAIPHVNDPDESGGDEFLLEADSNGQFLFGDDAYTDGGGPLRGFAATHDVAPVLLDDASPQERVNAIRETNDLRREFNS